ncbi:MAG: hypothetical protein ACYDD4_06315 [Acidimicrobiales bacterium]
MTVAMGLPRADAITDALLAPAAESDVEALRALRQRLLGSLTPLAAEIPAGQRLILDVRRLVTAMSSPERCGEPDGEFHVTAVTCRHAVALRAVSIVARTAMAPAAAVGAALDDAEHQHSSGAPGAPWWAQWSSGLGRAGRCALSAEATTWATQIATSLRLDRLPAPLVIGGADEWWNVPGAASLSLKGRADIRMRRHGVPLYVVVRPGSPLPTHRAELLFPALVTAMASAGRIVPARVLGIWPACGQVRVVDVDAPSLSACATQVAAAVGTWVDTLIEQHRKPLPAPRTPMPHRLGGEESGGWTNGP